MDDMLTEIGNMTDAEVQDKVLKLTATLEPIITVVMGIFILTLALSIFCLFGICTRHCQKAKLYQKVTVTICYTELTLPLIMFSNIKWYRFCIM